MATYNFAGYEIPAIVSKDTLIGCQFHPEFLSTLEKPAPLFVEFIKKCILL